MKSDKVFIKKTLSLILTATLCQTSIAASQVNDEQEQKLTTEENRKSNSNNKDEDVEIINVTGSQIGGTGFIASSPITIVSAADLEKSAPSTLAAALNNLPALVAQGGPNASSGQTNSGRNL